jgi:uncharacterized protein (DUF1778 family)
MQRKSKTVTFRLPDNEAALLAEQAKASGRTRTDLLRAFVRSLGKPPQPRRAQRRRPDR